MELDNEYSNGFERVELDGIGIKKYLDETIKDTETKVLVNLLITYLIQCSDKKIQACELLLEDLEHYDDIKEACYCLAYGTNYIRWKPK